MLKYEDVLDTPYTLVDQFPTLTPEALTLLVFLLEQAADPAFWVDYFDYMEEIDNSIGSTVAALLDGVS